MEYYYTIIDDCLYAIYCDEELINSLTGFNWFVCDSKLMWNVITDLTFEKPNKILVYRIYKGEIYKLWSKTLSQLVMMNF